MSLNNCKSPVLHFQSRSWEDSDKKDSQEVCSPTSWCSHPEPHDPCSQPEEERKPSSPPAWVRVMCGWRCHCSFSPSAVPLKISTFSEPFLTWSDLPGPSTDLAFLRCASISPQPGSGTNEALTWSSVNCRMELEAEN